MLTACFLLSLYKSYTFFFILSPLDIYYPLYIFSSQQPAMNCTQQQNLYHMLQNRFRQL